jgi:hypothetical protein
MPDAPYAGALRELTEISQGFTNDPSVLLVQEYRKCKEAQRWSAILAGNYYNRYQREGTQVLFLPPGLAPPLI